MWPVWIAAHCHSSARWMRYFKTAQGSWPKFYFPPFGSLLLYMLFKKISCLMCWSDNAASRTVSILCCWFSLAFCKCSKLPIYLGITSAGWTIRGSWNPITLAVSLMELNGTYDHGLPCNSNWKHWWCLKIWLTYPIGFWAILDEAIEIRGRLFHLLTFWQ